MNGPFALAARAYRELGWEGTLPVVGKDINLPKGYMGRKGIFPTDETIEEWISTRGKDNIALRLPQNIIGIDIDAYDGRRGLKTIELYEGKYGALPPTWKSSSRTEGSGILLYTVPRGVAWVSSLGTGSNVDVIRFGHRIAVVWPSIHPDTRRQYRWWLPTIGTESERPPKASELAVLPDAWVAALTKHRGGVARELGVYGEQIGDVPSDSDHINPREVLMGVAPGEQDETLFRYLSSLWARNMTYDEMIQMGMCVIQGFENSRPDDPWTPEHVVQKVNNITRNYTRGNTRQQEIAAWQRQWLASAAEPRGGDDGETCKRSLRMAQGKSETNEVRDPATDCIENISHPESSDGNDIGNVIAGDGEIDPPQVPPPGSYLATSDRPPDATVDTDMGNSARFTRLFADMVRYCASTEKWHIWNGNRWEVDLKNRILYLTKDVVVDLRYQALAVGGHESDVLLAWAKQSESISRRNAMLAGAISEPSLVVLADEFDRNPLLLVVRNGTYDLEHDRLRKSRPEDLCSLQCEVSYSPGAECPQWLSHIKFITKGDNELAKYMQAAMGYCLTGYGSLHERAFFFLQGDGLNGKNAFIEPIMAVMGTYARLGHGTLLTGDENAHPTVLAQLTGARLVFIDETRKNYKLNAERIKALVGSKKITARFMHKDFFDFEGRFKLMIAGNGQPQMGDSSDGIWSRLHEIPMLGKAGRDVPVIKDFGSKLYNEEAEGILNWLIEGYRMWRDNGLTRPKIVADTVAEHRANETNDWMGQFIEDCILITNDPTDRIMSAELFTAWRMWCLMSNVPKGDIGFKNHFGRNFNKRMEMDYEIPRENLSALYRDPVARKPVRGCMGMRLISSS
jgi:P4 family phage/plasmid primase-like protien